jgi:hypothetical protein
VALIRKRLRIEAVVRSGRIGQFEVFADGESVAARGGNWFTRQFGAGYPDLDRVVKLLERREKE